jgi:hypothetical protein
VPESPETRIARLEASRDEHRELIRQVVPLVAEYAVLNERFHNLAGDVTEGFKTARENAEKTDAAVEKHFAAVEKQFEAIADKDAGKNRERRAIYTALGLSLLGLIINLALQLSGLSGGHP